MKKQIIAFGKTIVPMLIIINTSILKAEANPIDSPAVVKYLGKEGSMNIFQVRYENLSGAPYLIIVKDEDGNTLFKEIFDTKQFDKKFKLVNLDNEKVTFIIKRVNDIRQETFEVNYNTRVVEDVIVKKVS
jgi:hypothetical protein